MQDFRKGGPENLRIMKTIIKIFQPKTKSVFCPKLGENQKKNVFSQKKKGLHSNLVRYLAQNYVKAKTKVFSRRFCIQTLCQSYKGRGYAAILHTILCYLYYPGDPKGGYGPMAPPKYAPDKITRILGSRLEQNPKPG